MFVPLKKSAKFIRPVNVSSRNVEISKPERLKPTPIPRKKLQMKFIGILHSY